jgi:hypothetical protein
VGSRTSAAGQTAIGCREVVGERRGGRIVSEERTHRAAAFKRDSWMETDKWNGTSEADASAAVDMLPSGAHAVDISTAMRDRVA